MNDLVAEGVGSKLFNDIVAELKEILLCRESNSGGIEHLSFQCRGLAAISMAVSTPSQVAAITEASIYRLERTIDTTFMVPLIIADLSKGAGHDKSYAKNLFIKASGAFGRECGAWSRSERHWWIECISELVSSAGFDPKKLLGEGFALPKCSHQICPSDILRLRKYKAPISFGPLGHALSIISRNMFQEYGAHCRSDGPCLEELRETTSSATKRYTEQTQTLDELLRAYDVSALSEEAREKERRSISLFSVHSESAKGVEEKAKQFFDFVKVVVTCRLEALHQLVAKQKELDDPPSFMTESDDRVLVRAYGMLQSDRCWKDSVEDALMHMSVHNWQPRPLPEGRHMPCSHRQTVCRIRDEVLRQVGRHLREDDGSETGLEYRPTVEDCEAFLVTTILLHGSMVSESDNKN